ncbi:MAG: glycosyl hydrolase 115 family protein [Kiritimatiellia bacterium]
MIKKQTSKKLVDSVSTIVLCATCLISSALFADSEANRPVIEVVKGVKPAYIVLAKSEHKGALAAAKNLQRDITKITGVTPNIVHALNETWGKCIVIGSADCPAGAALLTSVGVSTDDLKGKWEIYKYRVLNNVGGKDQVLAIAGSNVRGTIFGIYDFEQKHLGVDPFWFWADHEPATQGELIFDNRIDFGPTKEPTWKYRGWTLNDHPQFMEWLQSGIVQRARYSRYMFAIHPEVFERLWEAALRLKMNMVSWYFIDIDWHPDYEQLKAAVDRGLFITQHQMEGVGANTAFWDDYWDNHNPDGKPKIFSYLEHPETFHEFWSYYIKRWSEFSPQVVWEINLRGRADGVYSDKSLPDGGTEQQRSEIITKALANMVALVRKIDPNPDLEMMTSLYSELGKNYDKGWLTVPEGVTAGFCDAGMHGMSYSKKFWTEPRDPKRRYGQYFHTQYFGGGPQFAKCTPIETYLKVNMDAMFERGDTQHMLLAMNELRHQQLEIRGIAEMLWDYPGFDPREYLQRYCREEFGESVAPKVAALYDAYYEKYPHTTRNDGNKTIPNYVKVMEPFFTVVANLLNIGNNNRDGFKLAYQFNREMYEQGIRDLGEVLDQALALRSSIPENRCYFFDYEFVDAIRIIRGVYKLSIATQDAIDLLANGDRAGALAALLDARPLTEELVAAFRNECGTEKWKYWFRSGTNEDFYQMYNLYQKARLKLETESMDFVTEIEPQRHPYFGNVVMHDPAQIGDAVYGSQAERLSASLYNGSRHSLTAFPLKGTFHIAGSRFAYSGWKNVSSDYTSDHGLSYRFTLQGRATVYVAKPKANKLDWLEADEFAATSESLTVGNWNWPFRYRNRPPNYKTDYELFAKTFQAGEIKLGPNAEDPRQLPYVVFVRPELLVFENFRSDTFGDPPAAWSCKGRAVVVDVPDYDAEIRPSVFDLSTVPRYQPLDLRGLKLEAGASALLAFPVTATNALVLHARVKAGQTDQTATLMLVDKNETPIVTVSLNNAGKILANNKNIADYATERWYMLTVRVAPTRKTFTLTVQNDTLETATSGEIKLPENARLMSEAFRAAHEGNQRKSWFIINAVTAWEGQ